MSEWASGFLNGVGISLIAFVMFDLWRMHRMRGQSEPRRE